MFLWVDVDTCRVVVLMFARAPVWVTHLIVKGIHLLNPIFLHWILIFIVKPSAI